MKLNTRASHTVAGLVNECCRNSQQHQRTRFTGAYGPRWRAHSREEVGRENGTRWPKLITKPSTGLWETCAHGMPLEPLACISDANSDGESSNNDETRKRAALELRDQVVISSRGE